MTTMSEQKNQFRQVLGQYPTGVCAVTAAAEDGPAGMVVGTFSSISMDPPIVGFMPAKSSSTWPKIERAGSFCVNVLAEGQEDVCRALSARGPDKFAAIGHRPGATGSPVLDGALAWIECRIRDVVDAGDHVMVLGDVLDMQLGAPALPMLFFRGGYGGFSPGPLVAESFDDPVLLRLVDAIRDEMQTLAAELGVEASTTGVFDGRLALIASTWSPFSDRAAVRAGDRVPFRPPFALPVAAWGTPERREEWLTAGPAELRSDLERVLKATVDRGWALSVRPEPRSDAVDRMLMANAELDAGAPRDGDPDRIDQRNLSAPVFGADGRVAMSLSVSGMTGRQADRELFDIADRVVLAARRAERHARG